MVKLITKDKKLMKIKHYFKVFLLFAFGISLSVSVFPVQASETDIPEELQVSIFMKALSYDTVITGSSQKIVNIGVIVNPGSSKSVSNKDSFIENVNSLKQGIIFFSKETFLSNKPVRTIPVNLNSLGDLKKHDISILYLTEDLSSLAGVSKYARENKTLTLSSQPEYVRNGMASVGIMTKNNRPKLIVNSKSLKQEGHEFGPQVMKFSELVE